MGVLQSEQKSFKSLQIEQIFDRFDQIFQISRRSRLHEAFFTIQRFLPPCVDKFLITYGSAPVGAEILQIFTNQTNTTQHLSFTTNKNLQKSNNNDEPVQIPVQFFVRFLKIFEDFRLHAIGCRAVTEADCMRLLSPFRENPPCVDKFLTLMGVLQSEQKSFKSLQIEQIFDRFDQICQISRRSRLHEAFITIQRFPPRVLIIS